MGTPETPDTPSDMLSTLPVPIPKITRSASVDSTALTQYSRDTLLKFQGTPRCKQLPALWDTDRLKTIMFSEHVNDIQRVIDQLQEHKGQQVKLNDGFNIQSKQSGTRNMGRNRDGPKGRRQSA